MHVAGHYTVDSAAAYPAPGLANPTSRFVNTVYEPATGQYVTNFDRTAYARYRAGTGLDPTPLDYLKTVSDGLNGVASVINAVNNGGQGTVPQPVLVAAPQAPASGGLLSGDTGILLVGGIVLLAVLMMG